MYFPDDATFSFYFYVTYTTIGNGSISGNYQPFGKEKLTVEPYDNNFIDEIIFDYDGNNETILEPDENGDYYMPYLGDTVTDRNVEVRACFKPVQKTVVFYDEDGTTVLQSGSCDYGTAPEFSKSTPTKPADAQYTYTFAGWTDGTNEYKPTDALPVVTADASYTAVYSSTTNEYTVKFIDDSGKELQSSSIKYDQVPSYAGDTPAKAETDKYTYTFEGWTDGTQIYGPSDELPPVTGNVIYNAVFIATEKDVPDPEVAPVKPVVDPDIKPVTTEVEVQKPGVYYLNSLTGDGVTTDVVATIKRTEDDVHCVEYFGNAEVDGTPMTVGEQILVGSGSTIITIKKEFLATIGEGTHTLKVLFTDGGSITIEFTVKAAANNGASVPSTGETIGMTTVLGACLILGAGGVVVAFAMKKRKDET